MSEKDKKMNKKKLYIKLLLTLTLSSGLFLFFFNLPEPWNIISILPAFYGGFIYSFLLEGVK